MSDLTPQQEAAMATFKENLHLPNGGFHKLITELSKEYQLPFQKVRTVFKKTQKDVERRIKNDFYTLNEESLTQQTWITQIKVQLTEMSKEGESVVNKLLANPQYISMVKNMDSLVISSEFEREDLIESLIQVYEKEVFKPLLAMLRTTKIYWTLMLVDETCKMTPQTRAKFSDYPDHMQAAEMLYELDQKIRAKDLG